MFHLALNLIITSPIHLGKRCRENICSNQRWSRESYVFFTSIHAILRLRRPLWLSWQTIRSMSRLSIVPLQCSLAPRCSPCISPFSFKCLSTGFKRHDVNHFYMVLRKVIDLWFSLKNSPAFEIREVFPSANQNGTSWSPSAIAWKDLATPSWTQLAFFHQKLTIRSGPGEFQFRFFVITLYACSVLSSKASSNGSSTLSFIALRIIIMISL